MSEYPEQEKMANENSNRIDLVVLLIDFLKSIRKMSWLCVLLMAVGGLGMFVRQYRAYVPMYKCEATLAVNISQNSLTNTQQQIGFAYNASAAAQISETFPYILQSEILTGLIKEDLGVRTINGSISASTMNNSNLVTITVVSNNPQDARNILQSVINNYSSVALYVIGNTQYVFIDPPNENPPSEPYNIPNYIQVTLRGMVMGLLAALVIIFLFMLTRSTIRTPEEIKEKLNLRSVGSVPMVHFKKRKTKIDQTISIQNDNVGYRFQEVIRTLAVRVEKDMQQHNSQILMVTSALPQEGKTTVALNLAYRLAATGKKVVLVDANFRKPELRMLTGVTSQNSELSDYLENGGQLKVFVAKGYDKRLFVMGNLKPCKNPSGLLGSHRMKKMLEKLRTYGDYIIIDTPPTELAADAGHVAGMADAVLFVVQQDEATVNEVMDGISMLGTNRIRILGCLMNKMKSGLEGYGYYGYGRYGYGRYGYNRYGYKRYGYGRYGRYGYGRYGYGRYGGDEDGEENE